MTIAATRMHSSLVDFASGPNEVYDIFHFLSFFMLIIVDIVRTHDNRTLSSLVFSKTKRADTAPTTLDRIIVSFNKAFERRSTGSKNDGDSSMVFSTSEQMPQISSDPPKLDLTEASTHRLSIVSPSPVPEAESV